MSVVTELAGTGIWVAPMAGGPTTPQLIAATSQAGALAFVAAAYKRASDVEADLRTVRRLTSRPFGVNVFVPGAPTATVVIDRYRRELEPDARRLGVPLGSGRWDDDDWTAKLELLVEEAPAAVSFTFGLPTPSVIDALRARGTTVVATVTSPAEAATAAAAGVDVLCAQGIEAGAHRATFDDVGRDEELSTLSLVAAICAREHLPVVATGGIATPADVHAAVRIGAHAVQAGTVFLRCDESGARPVHKDALADLARTATALTRAFTGRRARGLVNEFVRRHPHAPSAFPEVHHLTTSLRAEAARRGDPEELNLWAGTSYRHARAEPAADVVVRLAEGGAR